MRYLGVIGAALVCACGRGDGHAPRHYREIVETSPTRAERAADVAAMIRAEAEAPGSALPQRRTDAPLGAGSASTTVIVARAGIALRWTLPPDWSEEPGNPMRLMTFRVGPERAECTLTAFPGAVGGIEGNLARWAGQLELSLAPEVLSRFARSPKTFETEGKMPCLLYDFTTVSPESDPSMLAAILPLEGRTVFVKLVAPRRVIEAQRGAFEQFCRSLRPE